MDLPFKSLQWISVCTESQNVCHLACNPSSSPVDSPVTQHAAASLTRGAFSWGCFFSSASPALTGPSRPGPHLIKPSLIVCPLALLLRSHGSLSRHYSTFSVVTCPSPTNWVYSKLPKAKDHRIIKIFCERHPACNE